jgi:isopentenyl phosphate kinase
MKLALSEDTQRLGRMETLIFLKLGGSLITEKTRPHTHRPEVISRLSEEIQSAREENPQLQLIIGHGSGSFGHTPAQKYNTRQGVYNPNEWSGFFQVWQSARDLNNLVWEALSRAGIQVVVFPPSACVSSHNKIIVNWNIQPIQAALQAGLVPLIYGDVIFDDEIGGTIFSTEDLFVHLAMQISPHRILLAGIEPGVWAGYPSRNQILPAINPDSLPGIRSVLHGSAATDVTGGMVEKVEEMLALAQRISKLEVLIFSGDHPGLVKAALLGASPGTRITG